MKEMLQLARTFTSLFASLALHVAHRVHGMPTAVSSTPGHPTLLQAPIQEAQPHLDCIQDIQHASIADGDCRTAGCAEHDPSSTTVQADAGAGLYRGQCLPDQGFEGQGQGTRLSKQRNGGCQRLISLLWS